MDGGGAFAVNRNHIEVGLSRLWRYDRMVSVSAGIGQDDYRFTGLATEPWGRLNSYRVGLFARWGLDQSNWTLFTGPSIRSHVEEGADLDDAITVAVFGGASYKFSDRLTLGPGLGVVGQLEESARYFPVVIVNWDITERLNLGTGGGMATTGGPGISLTYRLNDQWQAGLTGRYEKKRFRLNGEGPAPNGLGEHEYIPVIANITYILYPGSFLSVMLGYNTSGNMVVENENGNIIDESEYENAFSFGLVASYRF